MKRQILRAAYALTSRVGPCRRWPNRLRRAVLPRLDAWARRRYKRPLTRSKDGHTDEHIASVTANVCEVERALAAAGYERNVSATLKHISGGPGDGVKYEVASWVIHDGQRQHHVYLFDSDRATHIWGHDEVSYLASADGHEDGQQRPGDPDGRLTDVLAELQGGRGE